MKKQKMFLQLVLILFFLPLITQTCQTEIKNHIYVANWNVENLFDTEDDPQINDADFLPGSKLDWNDSRLEKKLDNLAKVINFMNDGCGPDIIGLQEVENINVLKKLAYKLQDRDYIIAHRDSPDERGIDACLIYDRSILDIEAIEQVEVILPSKSPTRDILHVQLTHRITKELFHIFVNHWPSRRGGVAKSEPNRIAAASKLKSLLESLPPKSNIILLGDFNDEPDNRSINIILGAENFTCSIPADKALLNLSFKKFETGEGSYLFGGRWDMIDQIIISKSLLDGWNSDYLCDSFEVINPEFMLELEGQRKGAAKRTYNGTEYVGGFSDHFPVGAKFQIDK